MSNTIDRDRQGDPIAGQELAISREKARRAREQFEREYETRIQRERYEAGCCEMCGMPLTAIDRLLRSHRHRRCTTFSD